MTTLVVDRNEQSLPKFADALNQLAQGRSNAVGTFTLTTSATSTVVTATTCGAGSTPLYSPTTAHASAEIGNGTIYVSTVENGSFTVTHANNSQADRTFLFVCLG